MATAPTAPTATARAHGTWSRRLAGLIVALGLAALVAETVRVAFGDNFHVVIPGTIYRSAEPTPEFLADVVQEHGIRTVLNLRGIGDGPIVDWYEREAAACQELGLSHENLTFSASRTPSIDEVRRLLEVLDRSEKPILVHCRRGADRTGLASAIALLAQTDTPYAEARASLGLRYGHWRLGSAGKLDSFFDEYETWLREKDLRHDQATFRRWIADGYRGGCCAAEIVAVQPPPGPLQAGKALPYRITYRNVSRSPWHFRSIGKAGIHLGISTFGLEGQKGTLTMGAMLDRVVPPGETIELTALVPPLQAGRHRLQIDLIEMGNAWFRQVGSDAWEEELNVRE
jgi:protein tyrosine/serine phosphatase